MKTALDIAFEQLNALSLSKDTHIAIAEMMTNLSIKSHHEGMDKAKGIWYAPSKDLVLISPAKTAA